MSTTFTRQPTLVSGAFRNVLDRAQREHPAAHPVTGMMRVLGSGRTPPTAEERARDARSTIERWAGIPHESAIAIHDKAVRDLIKAEAEIAQARCDVALSMEGAA